MRQTKRTKGAWQGEDIKQRGGGTTNQLGFFLAKTFFFSSFFPTAQKDIKKGKEGNKTKLN